MIVTGGYSGIGIEEVRALAGVGAKVTVPARRPDAAKQALGAVDGDIEIATMDLGDLASVRKFATDYVSTDRQLDILINNAGIMACPLARVGPGWESQFGINHLGHMALAVSLLPALQKAETSRVVALSSTAHIRGDVNWDDPNYETTEYEKWNANPRMRCLRSAQTRVGTNMASPRSACILAVSSHRCSAILRSKRCRPWGG